MDIAVWACWCRSCPRVTCKVRRKCFKADIALLAHLLILLQKIISRVQDWTVEVNYPRLISYGLQFMLQAALRQCILGHHFFTMMVSEKEELQLFSRLDVVKPNTHTLHFALRISNLSLTTLTHTSFWAPIPFPKWNIQSEFYQLRDLSPNLFMAYWIVSTTFYSIISISSA